MAGQPSNNDSEQGPGVYGAVETSSVPLGSFTPRGKRRLIYVSDPSNTTSHLSEPAAQPEELRQIVRNYAQAGSIDTVVQEIFAEAMTMFWRTDKCPYDIRFQHERLIPIMDDGIMPVEIYIDECHRQGLEFIAGFRMNDRHGHHPEFFKKLCEEKPEWVLREYKPSTRKAPPESREYGCSVNYAIPEVRAWLLSIMEEVANRFVYPQTQPRLSIDTKHIMTPAQYRAALQNFYGAGADGFSTQNFFFHWGPKFDIPGDSGAEIPAQYPTALNHLKELKDPESMANDRHYVFIPLWAHSKGLGQSYERAEIILSRKEIGQRKTFRFRICEKLPTTSDHPKNNLTFFPQGLSKTDVITVAINDTEIPSNNLKWTWQNDDQLPFCTIPLSTPPFVYGDNYLSLALMQSVQESTEDIIVEHVECRIQSLPE